MHNLHLVVINATSIDEAYDETNLKVLEWGGENNWFEICGAIDEDGIVYNESVGRFPPDSYNLRSLADINNFVINKINEVDNLWGLENKVINLEDKLSSSEWYRILTQIENIYQRQRFIEINGGVDYSFDVLEGEYRGWEFDYFGVTQVENGLDKGGKKYVVFVDIHS